MRCLATASSAALPLVLLLVLVLVFGEIKAEIVRTASTKSPVVLVPGDGGTQLWASLKSTNNHWYCETTTSSPTLIWVNVLDLVYPAVNCLVYNLKLIFNPKTGLTTDNYGVKILIKGFNNTETVEWLSNIKLPQVTYYYQLVEHLVNNYGYRRGIDVHGAPFDFRKAPNELSDYYRQLTNLIESTYKRNGRQKVVIVGHSLGCKVVLHYLHNKPIAWKAKYIKEFVSAAGPFGGSASSLLAAIAGYNLGLSFIKPLWVRESQRSWPSTYYLTPSPLIFNTSKPIVSRPGRNYTLSKKDLQSLYNDIGNPIAYKQYLQTENITEQTKPPQVATTCVFGQGVQTARKFKWLSNANFPDTQPYVTYGDGDGTVNIESLDVCYLWQRQQKHPVATVTASGADHMQILERREFIDAVVKAAVPGT